ncbi:hypothetical protein V7127_01735 [Bacillus sp. JJ1773]
MSIPSWVLMHQMSWEVLATHCFVGNKVFKHFTTGEANGTALRFTFLRLTIHERIISLVTIDCCVPNLIYPIQSWEY